MGDQRRGAIAAIKLCSMTKLFDYIRACGEQRRYTLRKLSHMEQQQVEIEQKNEDRAPQLAAPYIIGYEFVKDPKPMEHAASDRAYTDVFTLPDTRTVQGNRHVPLYQVLRCTVSRRQTLLISLIGAGNAAYCPAYRCCSLLWVYLKSPDVYPWIQLVRVVDL